jgi:hypothetical protein
MMRGGRLQASRREALVRTLTSAAGWLAESFLAGAVSPT